jgi:hypothetical protein
MSALPPKADMCARGVRFGPIADMAENLMLLSASILVFHRRRKAASRAALHRRETERLAVVRHPRILP